MKKLLFTGIALFAGLFSASAQNHGFMGKYFMATYQLHVLPRTFTAFEGEYIVSKPRVDFSHELQAALITGRHTTLQFNYQYGNYKALRYKSLYYPDEQAARIISHGYGLGFNFYLGTRSSPLAPVGSYIKTQLTYLDFDLKDEVGTYNLDPATTPNYEIPTEYKGASVRFTIGKGRSRVIKDNFIIDYGADFTFGLAKAYNQVAGPAQDYYDFYHEAISAGLQANLLAFHIGVGGLLF